LHDFAQRESECGGEFRCMPRVGGSRCRCAATTRGIEWGYLPFGKIRDQKTGPNHLSCHAEVAAHKDVLQTFGIAENAVQHVVEPDQLDRLTEYLLLNRTGLKQPAVQPRAEPADRVPCAGPKFRLGPASHGVQCRRRIAIDGAKWDIRSGSGFNE
jgi:hypothetical protein